MKTIIFTIFLAIYSYSSSDFVKECKSKHIKVFAKSEKDMLKDDAIEYAKIIASVKLIEEIYAQIVSQKIIYKKSLDSDTNITNEEFSKEIILKASGYIEPVFTYVRYFELKKFAIVEATVDCENLERFINKVKEER